MLIGLVAFVAYSVYAGPRSQERVYFEGDSKGRLSQVSRPSSLKQAPPQLWKPEPSLLLRHATLLKLTPQQEANLNALHQRWSETKETIEARLAAATRHLSKGEKVSIAEIRGGLSGYSEISRAYDESRKSAWREALALLDNAQIRRLNQEVKP